MILLWNGFIWVVIGWCKMIMNFSFIIRKFLYIGSRLWYGSWPYFCVNLGCGERVGWCGFRWLLRDYWTLFENGLVLFGILWFWGWDFRVIRWDWGFLGSWKLLEIKDFSKVRRSSSRMKIGYFEWEFGWLREVVGRLKIEWDAWVEHIPLLAARADFLDM